MNTLLDSQVFFFISSIGFVLLWVLTAIFLMYLIRATNTLGRIMGKAEDDIDKLGDISKEMLEDIHDSFIFSFLFRKKKKTQKTK